uniref:BTB domain-containing protein n=1 Tax=Globodera rostochiensis TaxID=31243 RepID=A0A914H751_GLORO
MNETLTVTKKRFIVTKHEGKIKVTEENIEVIKHKGDIKVTLEEFAENLSMEWASFPYSVDGLSYYHADGKNKALVKWSELLGVLKEAKVLYDEMKNREKEEAGKKASTFGNGRTETMQILCFMRVNFKKNRLVASDVFVAMFRFDEENAKSAAVGTVKEVKPVEVEAGAFKVMLSFIYADDLSGLNGDNAISVLYAGTSLGGRKMPSKWERAFGGE